MPAVRLFGQPPGPAALRRIGYQSEIFHTYPFYKAREALRYYGRLSGMSRQAIDAAVPPLLARMGLEGAANRAVPTFSKGMTQRLGLAQAMLHDPELLILDEPTSGLDPKDAGWCSTSSGRKRRRGAPCFSAATFCRTWSARATRW